MATGSFTYSPVHRRWHSNYYWSSILALSIIGGALLAGILGYHFTEGLDWLDSLLNASMILGGMGPVAPLKTVGGKIFASIYALFSGIVILASSAVLLAPALRAFLHRLHLDTDGDPNT